MVKRAFSGYWTLNEVAEKWGVTRARVDQWLKAYSMESELRTVNNVKFRLIPNAELKKIPPDKVRSNYWTKERIKERTDA